MMNENEEWRPVKGWPNYAVSNLGRVWSWGGGRFPARILGAYNDRHGYPIVSLHDRGNQRTRFVHRLVALAFLPVDPSRPHVNHRDGIKQNNRCENLEWVTPQENSTHASETGLLATGERHGSRVKPGRLPTGENHWARRNPEKVARGDNHSSKRHPERVPRGAGHGMAKLTEQQVVAMRASRATGRTLRALAEDFGIDPGAVSLIVRGKRWKHIPL